MIFKSINARSKDARLYDIAFGAMTNKVYADGNGKKGQTLLYIDLQREDASGMFPGTKEKVEKGNRERENGMVYLARYLLGKACKGYDVWED